MKATSQASCSVVGCVEISTSVHKIPEDLRATWLEFIYNGEIPAKVGKNLFVCSSHFEPDCFANLGQFKAGFSTKLVLKKGSIPTIRGPTSQEDQSKLHGESLKYKDVACQTDRLKKCTVATQLSIKTLAPSHRSKGTQTNVLPEDVCTATATTSVTSFQPVLSSTPIKPQQKRRRIELEDDDSVDPLEGTSELLDSMKEQHDTTYDPGDSITILTESPDDMSEAPISPQKTQTYIVYENCLLELFQKCPVCQRVSDVRTRRLGTFISVQQMCSHCQFFRKWNSQPLLGSTPAGNLQLSSAVYITGSSFFQIEKVFRAMHLSVHGYDTFRRHARMYIEPAIVHTWQTTQSVMLEQLSQQQSVIVGGDMRADSPGHSAKFGCYTMMNLRSGKVIDLQLVQSNEVGGSNHMEKEGLKRSLSFLEARGVTIDSIVTDRHPQIQKFLRETNMTHYYDVWHIEKGISKKLVKISQNKECEEIKKWLRSIKNHIYWTAASSSSGPERVAKWTSITNHILDIHTHDNSIFPQCLHTQRPTRDRTKWLKAGTPAFCKLEKVMTNKRILKDVEKLSPLYQTSSLESFHSVILRFAPKNVVFPFLGMLCRLYLAALHFNENSGRPQATSSSGDLLYKLVFPKTKKGECTAKPVKVDPTFNYTSELMDLIMDKVFQDPGPYVDEMLLIPIPENLTTQFEKPDKLEVISAFVSRFNEGQV